MSESDKSGKPELSDADRIRAEICASVYGWDESGTSERNDIIRAYLEATLHERSAAQARIAELEKRIADIQKAVSMVMWDITYSGKVSERGESDLLEIIEKLKQP